MSLFRFGSYIVRAALCSYTAIHEPSQNLSLRMRVQGDVAYIAQRTLSALVQRTCKVLSPVCTTKS